MNNQLDLFLDQNSPIFVHQNNQNNSFAYFDDPRFFLQGQALINWVIKNSTKENNYFAQAFFNNPVVPMRPVLFYSDQIIFEINQIISKVTPPSPKGGWLYF